MRAPKAKIKNRTGPSDKNFEYQVMSRKISPNKVIISFGKNINLVNRTIKYAPRNIIVLPPERKASLGLIFIKRCTMLKRIRNIDAAKQVIVIKKRSELITSLSPKIFIAIVLIFHIILKTII